MMQTPGPADRQQMMGTDGAFGDGGIGPDTAGATDPNMGGRMPLDLPAQPQSWGLQNPALPNQLQGWLRNYYGGVGSLHQDILDGLVRSARQGGLAKFDPWNVAHGDLGHGNAGLPDGGSNLPADGTLAGMGTGPKRFGGSNDLSEPQPTWLGTVNPRPSWGQTIGAQHRAP